MIDPLDTRTLERARKAAGISRAFLSQKTDVHETTIMRIEKGEVDPRVDGTWAKLVRAMYAVEGRSKHGQTVPKRNIKQSTTMDNIHKDNIGGEA